MKAEVEEFEFGFDGGDVTLGERAGYAAGDGEKLVHFYAPHITL